ncbi:hypothetical protein LEP1GSC126_2425 [Leptospira kirschneri str. 200801774]|nr:hypothetical protein LEP1GSC126_2425 [Leptospira kirschneri str. 200801774]
MILMNFKERIYSYVRKFVPKIASKPTFQYRPFRNQNNG